MSSDALGLLALLQYGDSAYPAGGFAHSWGLETAVAEGHVTDAAGLDAVCRALLIHTAAPADAVAAAACCREAGDRNLTRYATIDARLTATRAAREVREASLRLGRRLLETAARAEAHPWPAVLRDAVKDGRTLGNHACALGAVAGIAGLTAAAAAGLALWCAAAGFLNAALRLLRVTHDDVQAILVGMRPLMARLVEEAVATDPLHMAGGAPRLEIWSMRHEMGTARLFAS